MKATIRIKAMKLEADGLTPEQVKKLLKGITKALLPRLPAAKPEPRS